MFINVCNAVKEIMMISDKHIIEIEALTNEEAITEELHRGLKAQRDHARTVEQHKRLDIFQKEPE